MWDANLPPIESFHWPQGTRAAISLSFDDGRRSQFERGIPLLDRYGIKATFYVVPGAVESHVPEWKAAVAAGHEIGNHTVTHPCSGNFGFARKDALEDLTLERMAREMEDANRAVQDILGVVPETFAYPCGQQFVGRGTNVQSYIPLVAQRFSVGRGWRDERHNVPGFCDLARIYGMDCDRKTFDDLRGHIDAAVQEGGWLVFGGHDISDQTSHQVTLESAIADLCEFALDPANGVWLDTVAAIGRYIRSVRG